MEDNLTNRVVLFLSILFHADGNGRQFDKGDCFVSFHFVSMLMDTEDNVAKEVVAFHFLPIYGNGRKFDKGGCFVSFLAVLRRHKIMAFPF